MSLLKKLNIKPIKNIRGGQWLFLWGKEWLLPKIGIAFGVYSISKILFSIDPSLWTEGQAGQVLLKFLEDGSQVRYLMGALILGSLVVVTIFCSTAKKINKLTFFLNQKFSLIVDGLIFIANIAFVPIIFSLYVSIQFPIDESILPRGPAFYLSAVIFISAALHFLKNDETNPENFIFYTLKDTQLKSRYVGRAIKETEKKLANYLSTINCVNNPLIVAHSKDGVIIIAIPIVLEFENWCKVGESSKEEFFEILNKIEQEWLNDGWAVIRFDSIDGILLKPFLSQKSAIFGLINSITWLLALGFWFL